MLKSMKARISAMMLAVVMALGVIGVANFAAVSASAAAGDTFGVGADHSATVTVTYESPQEVVSGASGQYFMYATVAGEHDLESLSLYLRNADEDVYEEYYFAYAPELNRLYAQVNVTEGTTYILGTYNETGSFDVSVYLAEHLAVGEFNGNSLYDVQLGDSLTVDLVGAHTGDYIVAVSVPDDATHTLALSASVGSSSTAVPLTYSVNMGYAYWGLVTLTDAATLTIHNGSEMPLVVSITLTPANTHTYGAWSGATGAKTYQVGETYYYTLTPSNAEGGTPAGFYLFNFSNYALVPSEEEPNPPAGVEITADFSVVIKGAPNDVLSTYVSANVQPVYLAEGVTYYIEIGCTFAYYEGTEDYVYPESIQATLALQRWDTTNVTVTPDETNYVPVSATGYAVTLNAEAGSYSFSLFDVPEGLSVTATYDGKDYTLNADNDYSVSLVVTETKTLTLTSSETFVASAFLSGVREPMTLGEAVTFTVGADSAATYYLTDLKAGSYAVEITGNESLEVWNNVGAFILTGYHYGVFTVEEDAAEYNLLFLNRGATQTVTVKVSAYEVPSIALGAESSITLAAGESKGYYLEGVTELGGYNVSLTSNTNVVVSSPVTDSTVVAANELGGGFIVGQEVSGGRVLLVFTNNGDASVTFEVTVHAAQEFVLGDNTVELTVASSVQYYYMVLPAGTYTITIDDPSFAVYVNGVLAIPLYDETGKFTVAAEEGETVYVAFVLNSYGAPVTATVTIALDAPVTD